MKQNTIETNEKCYISELSDLVESGFRDYAFKYASPDDRKLRPIGYMLTPVKQALDDLYALSSILCACIGQVKLDDKMQCTDYDISAEQSLARLFGMEHSDRRVDYTATGISIDDPRLNDILETIYSDESYYLERVYMEERLNDCLLRLNADDKDYTWKVWYVAYRGDGRITLVLDGTRKDKDKNQ